MASSSRWFLLVVMLGLMATLVQCTFRGKSGGVSYAKTKSKNRNFPFPRLSLSSLCEKCKCNCDIPVPECRWKRVFKQVSGTGQNVFQAWTNGGSVNEGDPNAENVTTTIPLRCAEIIDNWNQNIIDKVKVEVYKDGKLGTFFIFNGLGSTMMDWFSQERLITSPYADVKTTSKQFFSITGDVPRKRRFFITSPYAGCNNDCGYLLIADPDNTDCAYENVSPKPVFYYGTITETCSNFNGEVTAGDIFAISVRICGSE